MDATVPPVVSSRCTAGSKANTWPALPGSSDHTTRPDLSHTLMCTIDWSCRRLRMIRENDATRAGSPATNRPSASGAVTTRAKVAPRLFASLTATSRLTCRATTTVAADTTSSTTPPVRTKRSRARRTTDRGGPVSDSGAGMDIDEPVPDGDGDGLQLGVGTELGEQALDVAAARVERDAELAGDQPRVEPGR